MKNKIWLSSPHMGGEEIKYVQEAFESNWIAPLGPNVNEFEKKLAEYCGVKEAAALVSGTSAIHLALIDIGVGYGDEVICQSFTFSGSANPIKYVGATPSNRLTDKPAKKMSGRHVNSFGNAKLEQYYISFYFMGKRKKERL